MPFPNHPDKHRGEAIATPEHASADRQERYDGNPADLPSAVVVCYSRSLMTSLMERHAGETVGHYYGDLYAFDETDGRVGVLGNFGIGAPTTAMLIDELVADGVGTFLSVGIAGGLDHDVEMAEFVVCDRAIRDEGTSHHYVAPGRWATPDETLTTHLTEFLDERDDPYHVGPSWTTDAIYRETVAEVERYAAEGVLTVEMEASAVFAVAEARGVDAASMFVVSDYLGTEEWDRRFHLTDDHLRRLGDTAKDVLAATLD
ncbi:nucleoside phosphorylase [Halomarina oriensis]|uniref:Purine phosphorylase n=1 Tax=Halomarina oriensis TaxID=671145 RepID=A0A6B0GRR1_9EURY|nr:nucleoside phosphorylase [Halomarina oriensis]MWG36349.1 purine phosphorylase [Halomarina oriensis]